MSKRSKRTKSHRPDRNRRTVGPRIATIDSSLDDAIQAGRGRRHQRVVQIFQQIAQRIGDDLRSVLGICGQLENDGHSREAIIFLQAWTTQFPSSYPARLYLANLLFQEGKAHDAIEIVETAIARFGPTPPAHCLAAACYEILDSPNDATRHLHEALEQSPAEAQTNIMLAHWEAAERKLDEAIERLEKVIRHDQSNPPILRKAYHELGMALDRAHRFDEAFDAFTACGSSTRNSPEFDRINRRRPLIQITGYAAVASRELFEDARPVSSSPTEDTGISPTFLVGFPRSGTTMTEQILCAHSEITSADERPFLHETRNEAIRRTNGAGGASAMLRRLTPDLKRQLRGFYFHLLRDSLHHAEHSNATIIIDKLPLNLLDLPFINLVFPESKIIVALRDPRDVCLSCLMQDFRLNSEIAHFISIEDSARFYERVMGFYLKIRPFLSLSMIEIRYEDTVADLKASATRLLEFLGVAWQEDVLRFHEHARKRVISTPSFAAVRKPINQKAVARWKNYESHIRPALPHLQRFTDEFGYFADESEQ